MFRKITFAFVAILGIVALISCGEEEKKEEVIRPVRFGEVFVTGGEQTRTFTGTSQAGISTNLSFKVSGTVESVAVKVGDNVRKGEIIAGLDPKDYMLQVQEAEAALVQAQSQAVNSKNNYERVRQLYENRTSSKSDLDAARAADESAQATVDRMQNALELARRQLSYAELKAPTNGTIASRMIEINENVQAGQTIAVLNVGKDMEVALGLPENVINNVQRDMNVQVAFPSLGNKSFQGVVGEVSPSVGPGSSTYLVRAKIINPSSDVKSGMSANVSFKFGSDSLEELLVVPTNAVGEDGNGNFVFLIEEGQDNAAKVAKKYIKIGKLTTKGFEVLGGLSLGQKVATAGLQSLLDGQKVSVQ